MRARFVIPVIVILAAIVPAACTSGEFPVWDGRAVPVAGRAVAATDTARGIVVGTVTPSQDRPHLTLVGQDATGGPTTPDIPTTPAPGYGAEGEWTALAADGPEITAVAGVRGGAHGNVRWTQWSGGFAGVRDLPQEFWTFGGHEAGDLVGVAYLDDRPVIIGSWASPTTGFDVVSYDLEGETWRRNDSAGTPLASSRRELLSAVSVASRGDSLVLAGDSTHLEGGTRRTAEAWSGRRAADGAIAWTRRTLPGDSPALASAVGCADPLVSPESDAECVIAGNVGGDLALWTLRGDDIELDVVDDVLIGDKDVLLAPARSWQRWYVLVRSGDAGRLVVGEEGEWRVHGNLPTGIPVAVISHRGDVSLVTTDGTRSTVHGAIEATGSRAARSASARS